MKCRKLLSLVAAAAIAVGSFTAMAVTAGASALDDLTPIPTTVTVLQAADYADHKVIVLLIIGFLGATILGDEHIVKLYNRVKDNNLFYLLQEIIVVCLFIISISFMISSSYNPFIYFQF